MNLLVVTHKEVWRAVSEGGYRTIGGFPFQIEALAGLFDETRVVALERGTNPPAGSTAMRAPNLSLVALPEPRGRGLSRKLHFLVWLPRYFRRLWQEIGKADVIHALVPGDVGMVGLVLALLRRKKVFVRHCGTWGYRGTLAARVLMVVLRWAAAAGRAVVFATGGGPEPPERGLPQVRWIFSTTLRGIEDVPQAAPWRPGGSLELAFVGRLVERKNARAVLEAVPLLADAVPEIRLHLIGDGPERPRLEARARSLRVDGAVHFHGNLEHPRVLELLARCHLLVFPTRVAEGFPKAVLEAMACGLPVLVPPVSVLPSLIAEGVGMLLAGVSASEVADAVRELVNDPESLAAMGRRARQVAAAYTLDQWAQRIAVALEHEWGPLL